jgi:hypothetical protein
MFDPLLVDVAIFNEPNGTALFIFTAAIPVLILVNPAFSIPPPPPDPDGVLDASTADVTDAELLPLLLPLLLLNIPVFDTIPGEIIGDSSIRTTGPVLGIKYS